MKASSPLGGGAKGGFDRSAVGRSFSFTAGFTSGEQLHSPTLLSGPQAPLPHGSEAETAAGAQPPFGVDCDSDAGSLDGTSSAAAGGEQLDVQMPVLWGNNRDTPRPPKPAQRRPRLSVRIPTPPE